MQCLWSAAKRLWRSQAHNGNILERNSCKYYFGYFFLNKIFFVKTFSKPKKKQAPTIDSIERNIIGTQANVDSANSNLKTALKYKAFSTAAGGALIGTAIGGPIGFLAGL